MLFPSCPKHHKRREKKKSCSWWIWNVQKEPWATRMCFVAWPTSSSTAIINITIIFNIPRVVECRKTKMFPHVLLDWRFYNARCFCENPKTITQFHGFNNSLTWGSMILLIINQRFCYEKTFDARLKILLTLLCGDATDDRHVDNYMCIESSVSWIPMTQIRWFAVSLESRKWQSFNDQLQFLTESMYNPTRLFVLLTFTLCTQCEYPANARTKLIRLCMQW